MLSLLFTDSFAAMTSDKLYTPQRFCTLWREHLYLWAMILSCSKINYTELCEIMLLWQKVSGKKVGQQFCLFLYYTCIVNFEDMFDVKKYCF